LLGAGTPKYLHTGLVNRLIDMSASKKKIKLIHTSDIHLGDEAGHPASGEALKALVRAMPALGGDALLLVGDIFDNGRVGDDVLEFFLDQIRQMAVPAVLLPGNHDLYGEDTIYRRGPFDRMPANLHLFTNTGGETINFPELTLDFWGKAMPFHTPEFRPLEGMPARETSRWLVALAHGHFHFEDDRDQRSSPIYPEEVANAPCDYLALGHWDRHGEVTQGNVVAAYSGTPLGPSRTNPLGSVTVVDLDPDPATGVTLSRVSLDSGAVGGAGMAAGPAG